MEVSQTTNKELISYVDVKRKPTRHGKHRQEYFRSQKWKTYHRQKQKQYRAKLKASKPKKPTSDFQLQKQNLLLKLLVNKKSFVPVSSKLKHPTIKNWNNPNYWYSKLLNLHNLLRGCVRIYENQWNNCFIIWLDLDQKGWTKLAKFFRCGYVKSPKGHIRIPIPVQYLQNYKTGVLYYLGKKIGDAKLSGEVMLPGNAYYDKKGNFLGYYEYKAWGTFFPFNNKIWTNIEELFSFLQAKVGLEYKTISQHISIVKNKGKVLVKDLTCPHGSSLTQLYSLSVREPPWLKEEFPKIGTN
jgi:hypothetical protein